MKTKNIFALAALGLLSLNACSNEEELTTDSQHLHQAVKFEASIQQMPQTRTTPADDAQSTQFNVGDQISISDGEQKSIYVYKTEGYWCPAEGQLHFYWTSETKTFSAQYPVVDVTNGFTVPTDQSDATQLAAADYMTYSGEHKSSNSFVYLKMHRKMARVNVTGITFQGAIANSNPQVKAVKFYSQKIVGGTATPEMVEVTPMSQNDGYVALLAPIAQTAHLNFAKVTVVYGENGTQTKDFLVKNTPALEAGFKYAFNLKINEEGLKIGVVSVSPWTEGTRADLEIDKNIEQEPDVDAKAHKVTLKEAGYLDTAYLMEALGSENSGFVSVEGPANAEDLQAIATFCKLEGKSIHLNLKNLTGLDALPANCFNGCTALTQITLPSGVTTIGANAFANSGLKAFTIPSSVTRIDQEILSGCSNLKTIRLDFVKNPNVTYSYDAKAFSGVGTTKEVALGLDPSWEEGLLGGDASNGYTFLGGIFKTAGNIKQYFAAHFSDAGITAGNKDLTVSSVTYETLVNFSSFNENNTIIGTEGLLLLRVGDVQGSPSIPKNNVQLCMQSTNLNVDNSHGLVANTWYHLAMTYDSNTGKATIYINGNEVATQEVGAGKSFNISRRGTNADRGIHIGRFAAFQYGNRPFSGMMKEVRVWSVARTQKEIKDNMFGVDAQSTGLEVYYKLDGTDISASAVTNATGKPNGDIYCGNSGALTTVDIEPIEIP